METIVVIILGGHCTIDLREKLALINMHKRNVFLSLQGVYASEESDGKRGARGHSLLAAGRPRHVTLLALVRDAVACLPSGEGTRAHITALLR